MSEYNATKLADYFRRSGRNIADHFRRSGNNIAERVSVGAHLGEFFLTNIEGVLFDEACITIDTVVRRWRDPCNRACCRL